MLLGDHRTLILCFGMPPNTKRRHGRMERRLTLTGFNLYLQQLADNDKDMRIPPLGHDAVTLLTYPDEPSAFTEGPAEGSDYKYYQDPEYLKNQLRYRHDFDYFSLRIVLLEIGLWKSLKSVTQGWDGPPEELRKQLLKRRVPLLKYSMGVHFFDVVNICLTGDWGMSHRLRTQVRVEWPYA